MILELVTRRFEIVTRGFALVIRGFKIVTRGFELVTRNSSSISELKSNKTLYLLIYWRKKCLHHQVFKKVFTPAPFVSFRSGYSLRSHLVGAKVYPLIRKKHHRVVGKVGVKLALTYKKLILFKFFSQKKFAKIIIIFILKVNLLLTLFLVKYVTYSMLGQWLTVFVEQLYMLKVGQLKMFTKDWVRRWYSPQKLVRSTFTEWETSWTTWVLWDKVNRQNWSLWSN